MDHTKKIPLWNICFLVLVILFVSITIAVPVIMLWASRDQHAILYELLTRVLARDKRDAHKPSLSLIWDTLDRCDLTKHDYASGEWIFNDLDGNTSSVTGLTRYYEVKGEVAGRLARLHIDTDFSSYDWIPHNCNLLKFDSDQFCSNIKSKNLLIVGDSISFMNMQSLFMQLNPESEFTLHQLSQDPIPICNCEGADLTFVRNDHLQNEGCKGEYCFPFFHLIERSSVMILNTGAHYRSITRIIERLDMLYEFLKEIEWKGYVIYRVTVPGHPKCKQGEIPMRSIEAAEERLDKHVMYDWGEFDGQNKIIEEYIRGKRNSFVLDVYNMTMLRPDGHRADQRDCLHYYLPSVVDTWTLLEYNLLQQILTLKEERSL